MRLALREIPRCAGEGGGLVLKMVKGGEGEGGLRFVGLWQDFFGSIMK